MWRSQGCRSNIVLLDPNDADLQPMNWVEARNYTVVFAILIGRSQVIINTSSKLLPIFSFLDVDTSASEELLTMLANKSQVL